MEDRSIMPAKAAEAGYFCFVDVDSKLHMRSLFSEQEIDADNRLVTYDERHDPQWLVGSLDRSVVSLCRYRYPDRDRTIFVSLTNEGEVGFIGRHEGFYERIPGAGMRAPGATRHGQMTKIRQIGARLYACGFGGQIYRRDAPGEWAPIDDGIRGPPTFENVLCLEDIDGPDERNIYVAGSLGGSGVVAAFDGARWRSVPTNRDLYAILIGTDATVWVAGKFGALLHGNSQDGFEDRSDPRFTAKVLSLAWFEGQLYLGTRSGLAVRDGDRVVPVETGLTPPLSDAHAIDAVDGVLWVFGYKSVARFDGARWKRYTPPR
jgi:hypothetical protein